MKKNLLYVFVLCFTICFAPSCSDDNEDTTNKKTDVNSGISTTPATGFQVTGFSPESGSKGTVMMITGANFGTDISNIRVLFDGDKEATVTKSNGTTIYCTVSNLFGGDNTMRVVVGGQEVTVTGQKFNYLQYGAINTVSGKFEDRTTKDGTLAEARFNLLAGVGVVSGGNLLAFDNVSTTRFVSITGNQVSTVATNVHKSGSPAVTSDGKTAYAIHKDSPFAVYEYKESENWVPTKLAAGIIGMSGEIWTATFADDDRWLYFRDSNGNFGRLDVTSPATVEILSNAAGEANGAISYLAYSAAEDCFYLSVENVHGIYRISKNGATVEQFAGFNGSGNADGNALSGAQFNKPRGLSVNANGDVFVSDYENRLIRKIDVQKKTVITVAGTKGGKEGVVDGPALSCLFSYPSDVAVDKDNNLFIVEYWGTVIRKLSFE